MRGTTDHRKPGPALGRRLPVVVVGLLLGSVLFLNYRPRYPIEFSTSYGRPPSRQEMVDAICALRGEQVRGRLEFVDTGSQFPRYRSTFRIRATGEEFSVWGKEVRSWKLGSYRPPLGVSAAPTQTYHRAFMRKYYPWVPVQRMQLMLRSAKVKPRLAFEYCEVTGEGSVVSLNRCRLAWDKSLRRLQQVHFAFAPLQVERRPRISRAEAERLALRHVTRTRGLLAARVGQSAVLYGGEYRHAAIVSADELGVQRWTYDVTLDDLKWAAWAHPKSSCLCDMKPTQDVLWVDAQTGAVFPILIGPFWESGVLAQRLTLDTPEGNLWSVDYPAMRLWGQPYICGKYLQSALWAGRYSFDRRSGVFVVDDQGLRWTGRRGSRFLRGPEGLSMAWMPPAVIDGELYLPTQMLRRITGWSLRGRWAWLTLRPPEQPARQTAEGLDSPAGR